MRKSVVDGRLLQSLTAWDLAGRQTTVPDFGAALRNMSLGFNFFYADDHGHIGYWHTGTYPIRPANADPRLPLPGDGRYDWQGFESWSAHPHVIDPQGRLRRQLEQQALHRLVLQEPRDRRRGRDLGRRLGIAAAGRRRPPPARR